MNNGERNDAGGPRVAQATSLAEAVQYQSGAVVSKTLVRQPGGSVTLFAFAAGQGLSEHTAPFDALVIIVEGVARVNVAGQEHVVKAGEMLLMPAGQPHALQADEPFKMLLVMVRS
ncbi:MAG: cupin domain-containing protein [Syntrophomonadaceae bacterium]|jgi:quercetin dioxygenase-like cupin family protein|nr:cupin domain-containing protein [Syntrophomonadaceae bacterium]MDH7497457.1 cupin domain-containing protein [Syntrophomonadaceae bacterium]